MGLIRISRDFRSPAERRTRTLRIFLPDEYEQEKDRRFPVLYMQDGQNVYSHAESARWQTWGVNDALEGLVADGRIEPWIVVAVDHSEARFHEYSLWDEPRADAPGSGEKYLRFLLETLKPHIDSTFRTRPTREWTAIMGSSLGGLFSLSAALRRPDVFGRIGAMSPSVMWGRAGLFREWQRRSDYWMRMYLDVGEQEGFHLGHFWMDYASAVPQFADHLMGLGYGEEELRFFSDPIGHHSEEDWRRRLPDALRWLLQ